MHDFILFLIIIKKNFLDSSEDYLKKQNSQINQEYHMENNNRLILQKEASSISFDNNTRFENNGLLDALSLARVESKNYNNNNFLIEPDNKNDFYPGDYFF